MYKCKIVSTKREPVKPRDLVAEKIAEVWSFDPDAQPLTREQASVIVKEESRIRVAVTRRLLADFEAKLNFPGPINVRGISQ